MRPMYTFPASNDCDPSTEDPDISFFISVKFYPEIEICCKEVDMEENEKQMEIDREKLEDFGQVKK